MCSVAGAYSRLDIVSIIIARISSVRQVLMVSLGRQDKNIVLGIETRVYCCSCNSELLPRLTQETGETNSSRHGFQDVAEGGVDQPPGGRVVNPEVFPPESATTLGWINAAKGRVKAVASKLDHFRAALYAVTILVRFFSLHEIFVAKKAPRQRARLGRQADPEH